MNLWITVSPDGKYFVTTDSVTYVAGSFKRALRAVRKVVADHKPQRLVFPSLRELKKWSRVENPEHQELQQPLLDLIQKKGLELTLPPGESEAHPWPTEKVALVKQKPRAAGAVDNRILVYTDGSCLGNPGFGGWGFSSKTASRSGSAPNVTNNMMEMTAVLEALRHFRKKKPGAPLKIVSDSMYLINGCTKWRHKWALRDYHGVKNHDLWRALARELALADVEFAWVKGHSGVEGNERADKLAGDAARCLQQEMVHG